MTVKTETHNPQRLAWEVGLTAVFVILAVWLADGAIAFISLWTYRLFVM